MASKEFVPALLSGSAAGACVDGVLFPLDAIKTRLQSPNGFLHAGGFRGIYKGFAPALLGSAPGGALFFSTYTVIKHSAAQNLGIPSFSAQILAACCGETVACLIRVPVEVIKQRAMVSKTKSPMIIFRETFHAEGFRGFYRGFSSTVMREIPFSIIQFPLWEFLKSRWAKYQNEDAQPWQSSVCGAIAGGIAATVTTPLDVAKTRIILAKHQSEISKGSISLAIVHIYKSKGVSGLFDGVVPRVMWISLGGAIFLGLYDKVFLLVSPSWQ